MRFSQGFTSRGVTRDVPAALCGIYHGATIYFCNLNYIAA